MAQKSGNKLVKCTPKSIADWLLRNGIDSWIAAGVARYSDSLRAGRLSRFGLHSACAVFESSQGRQLLLQECSWLLGCTLVILYTEMGIKVIFFGRTETVPWDRRKTLYEELHLFLLLLVKYYVGWSNEVCIGEMEGACRNLWGNLGERDYSEKLRVDGKILLKWVFRKWVGIDWTDVAQDRGK